MFFNLGLLTGLSRAQKRAVLLVTDAGLIWPALWMSVALRADQGFDLSGAAPLVGGLMAVSVVLSWLGGIADTRISAYEERAAFRNFGLSGALAGLLFGLGGLIAAPAPGGFAVLFWIVHVGLSVLARLGMALMLRLAYGHGAVKRRVLILGAGSFGMQALRMLKAHPDLVPVGFIDETSSLHGLTIGGLRVYPPLDLAALGRRLRASDVLIAQPTLSPADRVSLRARIEASGLQVATIPALVHLAGGDATLPVGQVDGTGADRSLPPASPAVAETLTDRVVVITGAGGSIGSELAGQVLRQRPAKLILLDHSEYALFQIETALRPVADQGGLELVPVLGSVEDRALLTRMMVSHGVGIVIHAAAYKHVPLMEANPIAALRNNVLGTEVLVQTAVAAGVSRFVLISTDKAVAPVSAMGVSKWMAEQVVRQCRGPMVVSVVRFGNVLGSSGSVLPRFEQQVRTGGPVTVTDPRMERYFMTVEEAVHLVLEAVTMAQGREVFLFDMGPPVRIETLARRVIQAAGYTVRDLARPDGDIQLAFTGIRPGEKLTESLSLGTDRQTTPNPRIYKVTEPILSEIELARLMRTLRDAVSSGRMPDLAMFLPQPGQPMPVDLQSFAGPVTPFGLGQALGARSE